MKKDNGILFNTKDFLVETMEFTNEQVGRYITLLCLQARDGYLTKPQIKRVFDGGWDKEIMDKFFIENNEGFFYNEEFKKGLDKRSAYIASRANNRKKITK